LAIDDDDDIVAVDFGHHWGQTASPLYVRFLVLDSFDIYKLELILLNLRIPVIQIKYN